MPEASAARDVGPEWTGDKGRDRVSIVESFVRGLSRDDLTFLAVRDELYGGSWEEIQEDLRARRDGRPYIFKLISRIEEDLDRIERLRAFEAEHGVDLRQVAKALGFECM